MLFDYRNLTQPYKRKREFAVCKLSHVFCISLSLFYRIRYSMNQPILKFPDHKADCHLHQNLL